MEKAVILIAMILLLGGCKTPLEESHSEGVPSSLKGNILRVVGASSDFEEYKKKLELWDFGDLDEKLIPIFVTNPKYPVELWKRNVTGYATMIVVINEEGTVEEIFTESASHDDFAIAAAIALREWQFSKPTINGKPVSVTFRQKFPFGFKRDSRSIYR